jgi:hypothetical protein
MHFATFSAPQNRTLIFTFFLPFNNQIYFKPINSKS